MDINIENSFVKKCIKKEYQDRISFELQSKKHRVKALSRFAHSVENILKNGFIKMSTSEIYSYFGEKAENEMCYIISYSKFDGEKLLLKDAINFLNASYMAVILISSTFAIIKEEFEKGNSSIYIFKVN